MNCSSGPAGYNLRVQIYGENEGLITKYAYKQ
jgi:hypothetical protein